MSTAVIVPTFNAGLVWADWISALLATGIDGNDVYIIDSGSSDNTVLQSRNAGFNVEQIEKGSFNHGGTRQKAVEDNSGYEFVIFLTQDAILSDNESLIKILLPFQDERVGAVCGRQLPRLTAGVIESHARFFNYPDKSAVFKLDDKNKYGVKAAFISNSFSAYRISALRQVGGFPRNVISTEDMYVAAKMLLVGWKIAYTPKACVYHSHGYSLLEEFSRYFDIGVFHSRESWIREELGEPEGEGLRFIRSEWSYLYKCAWWKIPESTLRSILKYCGYRMGLLESKLPIWLKRKLSMNPVYFQ